MPQRRQSKGKCAFCGQEMAKSGVSKHLAACAHYQGALAKAEEMSGNNSVHYHLRLQASGLPEFWLDLEMRGSATLKALDGYLRAIWLECCGHMSQFSLGGWGGNEIGMSRRLADVLPLGEELTHLYDFGTTSITLIKAINIREGKPLTKRPITLLVRNVPPEFECIECKQQAAWLCMECMMEDDVWGTLCDEHAKSHPHDDYGDPIPLVNSPRTGMCGYEGPAEPPY